MNMASLHSYAVYALLRMRQKCWGSNDVYIPYCTYICKCNAITPRQKKGRSVAHGSKCRHMQIRPMHLYSQYTYAAYSTLLSGGLPKLTQIQLAMLAQKLLNSYVSSLINIHTHNPQIKAEPKTHIEIKLVRKILHAKLKTSTHFLR